MERGDKFTDFEEMEDGQLVCRESCPDGYVYEITELGNRCLKECKTGQVRYNNTCLSTCSQSLDLPYIDNGTCVKKCQWFVSDNKSNVCLSTCRTKHFEVVDDTKLCVSDCGKRFARETLINGQLLTGCYDRCSQEYMNGSVFEVQENHTCETKCDSGYFYQEDGRNICTKKENNETCKFIFQNATGDMSQCF